MECYCTCIIEILRYFFIQQSLTTSKMRKFQTLKLSQFHKEKTCWTENWWSSGIMSNFWGEFFYVLGGKKKFKFFFKKYFSNRIEKLHKMALIIFFEKTGIISTKFLLRCTPSVILGKWPKGSILWNVNLNPWDFTCSEFSVLVEPDCMRRAFESRP